MLSRTRRLAWRSRWLELPGLSSQHRENILGDFLRHAGVFDLAQGGGKYQVEMPPYEVGGIDVLSQLHLFWKLRAKLRSFH